jgi:adenylosuccinate synthase
MQKRYKGEVLKGMPADLEVLGGVEVVYETLPGWTEDISKCKTIAELPLNAQKYLQRIEELTSTSVVWVGVGPGREALLVKQ